MEVIYTGENAPTTITKSLFLAGPSLRPGQEKEMTSWRQDAIKILEDKGFDGVIFCPENRGFGFDNPNFNYDDQIEWENKHLNIADCILFWVPRDLSLDSKGQLKLPAFTTNIEWGAWADSGKVVFGSPSDLSKRKNKYLAFNAEQYNVPTGETLTETIEHAIEFLGEGDERSEGEIYVPLFIWKTPSFQSWYEAQKNAGNKLERAKLLWSFRPGYKDFVFLWVLRVSVFITAENRRSNNEFVLARTDISSVLLWHRQDDLLESEVITIREFRPPASSPDGFIHELPSGSSKDQSDPPEEVASKELHEETGFYLHPDRLISGGARQMCATLSAHKAHLFYAEIDEEELKWFKSQDGVVHGKKEDQERTYIEIKTIAQLLEENETDWSTLGMVFSVAQNK